MIPDRTLCGAVVGAGNSLQAPTIPQFFTRKEVNDFCVLLETIFLESQAMFLVQVMSVTTSKVDFLIQLTKNKNSLKCGLQLAIQMTAEVAGDQSG